jgi:hypothetical protein
MHNSIFLSILTSLPSFLPSFIHSFSPSSLLLPLMPSHAISSEVTSPNLVDDHCMLSESLISKLSVVAVVTDSTVKNLPSKLLETVFISYVVLYVT